MNPQGNNMIQNFFAPYTNIDDMMAQYGFPGTQAEDGGMDYTQNFVGQSTDPSGGFQTIDQGTLDMLSPEFYNSYLTYKRESSIQNILDSVRVYEGAKKNLETVKSSTMLESLIPEFHSEMFNANKEVEGQTSGIFDMLMNVVDQNQMKNAYYQRQYQTT